MALSPAEARGAIDDLVRFAFQPVDLGDEAVVGEIQWLVATLDTSSIVVNSLVALVVEQGQQAILLEAAGLRWLREHGYPIAAPALTPPGRLRGQPRDPRSDRTLHLLRAGRTGAPRSRASREV